jgi:hypothetical protein
VAMTFLTRPFLCFNLERTMSPDFGAQRVKLQPLHHCRTRLMFAFPSSDS